MKMGRKAGFRHFVDVHLTEFRIIQVPRWGNVPVLKKWPPFKRYRRAAMLPSSAHPATGNRRPRPIPIKFVQFMKFVVSFFP